MDSQSNTFKSSTLSSNGELSSELLHDLPKDKVSNVRKISGEGIVSPIIKPRLPSLIDHVAFNRKNYPKEYRCWDNMKQRCKGKYVIDPRFNKFKDFMKYMGPMLATSYTIDRKDNNNPEYSPDNCRWASKALQTANRSNTRFVTDSTGLRLSITEWSKQSPYVPNSTILARIDRYNWSEHDAVHTRVGDRRSKHVASTSYLPKNSDKYVEIYCKAMKQTHNQAFVPIEPIDRKQLKSIGIQLLNGGVSDTAAIKYVLEHWISFTKYADLYYGAFKPPIYPTVKYMTRAIAAIGNYYLLHMKEKQYFEINNVKANDQGPKESSVQLTAKEEEVAEKALLKSVKVEKEKPATPEEVAAFLEDLL